MTIHVSILLARICLFFFGAFSLFLFTNYVTVDILIGECHSERLEIRKKLSGNPTEETIYLTKDDNPFLRIIV